MLDLRLLIETLKMFVFCYQYIFLQICRTVAKDYIGKVSSAPLLQAFQSAIDKGIGDNMVPRVLRGFQAPITMTPGERVLGKITIPLTLSPQFEIRDVHYKVQLTAEDIA